MSRLWQLMRIGCVAAAFFALFGLAGLAATYLILAPTLPSVRVLEDVQLQVPLRVYTSDGVPIAVFGEKRRIPVTIENVPEALKHAFIAAEDDRFYEHPGVDYQGLLRATWMLLRTGEKRQGGSTITMQLARNFFLSFDRTYIRKLKEILLALKIEHNFSKPRIFELYLNKIYLGHRAYGVAAAAQVYYGKNLYELTLAEAAMIAALPRAPSVVNPLDHPRAAVGRRNYVLKRMYEEGYIGQSDYQAAQRAPDEASAHGTVVQMHAPFVAEMARRFALDQLGDAAYGGGFEIYTTVKMDLQRAAMAALQAGLIAYDRRHGYRGPEAHVTLAAEATREAVQRLLANYRPYAGLLPGLVLEATKESAKVLLPEGSVVPLTLEGMEWAQPYLIENAVGKTPQAVNEVVAAGDIIRLREGEEQWQLAQLPAVEGAMVAMDSFDGSVLALVGGFDFELSKFNRALDARRQPGSSIKPFIYSAALNHGMTPATMINDAPVVYDNPSLDRSWRPQNYSETFYGPTRLREALVTSRNLVSIRVLRAIGVDYAIDYLARFGFPQENLPRNLSLALGSAVVSPYQMARAYSVFANGGFRVQPHYIERIVGPDGRVLYGADPKVACLECDLPVAPRVVGLTPGTPDATGAQAVATNGALATTGQPVPPASDYAATSQHLPVPGEPAFSLAPRVIEAGNAYIMDSFMEDVVRRGTATRALSLQRNDLSGKTGTTNQQTNAWFCGYVPGLVATVWVGFDEPKPLGAREVGGRAALPIWIDFMEVALAHKPERDLPMPNGIVTVRIDPETGHRARAGDPDAILELFQAGNVPPLAPELEPIKEEYENPYDIF